MDKPMFPPVKVEKVESEEIELAAGETSIDFLRRVYRSKRQPMSLRMRAAIEAAPFEHPRVSAVAMGHFTKEDFATLLDRAVSRSAKVIAGKAIQIEAHGQVGIEEEH